MDPRLVLYSAGDLNDWSVEYRGLHLSGIGRESLLVVELLALPEVVTFVLTLFRSSGVWFAFLRSLSLLRTAPGFLQMNISGCTTEYFAHLRDIMLYQGCVEVVVDS